MNSFKKMFGVDLSDKSEKELETFLQNNCSDTAKSVPYTKRLSMEELDEAKDKLSNVVIFLNDKEIEKKEFISSMKDDCKPFEEEKKVLLQRIKDKSISVVEDCYLFLDDENRTMTYVNRSGDVVYQRGATPKELQGSRNLYQLKSAVNE